MLPVKKKKLRKINQKHIFHKKTTTNEIECLDISILSGFSYIFQRFKALRITRRLLGCTALVALPDCFSRLAWLRYNT